MAMPLWLGEKLFQKEHLLKKLKGATPGFDWESRLLFSEHHLEPRGIGVFSVAVRATR